MIKDLDRAYSTVQFYGESYEIKNLWETLDHMKSNWATLDTEEKLAHKLLADDLYIGLTNRPDHSYTVKIDEDDGYAD
jgi:hypothetical protein